MAKIAAGRENKTHIGIFGRCNAGKSTLLNFITGTDTAIVSPRQGTTTDLVRKSYEITGFSPVVFIDTGGIDDTSALAAERIRRTREAVLQSDLAIVVYTEWGAPEDILAAHLREAGTPFITLQNLHTGSGPCRAAPPGTGAGTAAFDISSATPAHHEELTGLIKSALPADAVRPAEMFAGLVDAGDTVILVCPIDSEAPAGRMILPQMQAVREALDRGATAVVVQPGQLAGALRMCPSPRLVVTDSQVYREVRGSVPPHIEVTTFSILLAASKGDMKLYTEGLEAVGRLRDGDRVLIAESCAHRVSCDDIGRVKIPAWLREFTGRELRFTFISGLSPLPDDLAGYSLMVQCGGCMVTRTQLRNRIRRASAAGVPVTNYGMLIRKIR
ncbi:MAG: [FeFe] hydrogenase H-cluster maturation GTPase HydF [Alistipes sp.]|nr:[FeFe] hydrogenase H-cluster maturation GTPase HydF [Alistipes sp.]